MIQIIGNTIDKEIITTQKKFRQVGIRAKYGSSFIINNLGVIYIGPTNIYEINLTNKNSYVESIKCKNLIEGQYIIDLIEEGE